MDEDEDRLYGGDKMGDELPEESQRADARRKQIREAMAQLKKRAEQKAKAEGKPKEKGEVKDKDQYNFTDPESPIITFQPSMTCYTIAPWFYRQEKEA